MANPYFEVTANSDLDSKDAVNAYLDGCIETLSTIITTEECEQHSKSLYLTVLNLETVKSLLNN